MTHPWDKKYHITFWLLILSGIGLCAAGIWVTPLLIPGGVCLAGAFGMFASSYVRMYPWKQDDPNYNMDPHAPLSTHEPVHHEERANVNITIDDHHIEFHPHYDMIVRPHNPSLEQRELYQAKSAPQLTLT